MHLFIRNILSTFSFTTAGVVVAVILSVVSARLLGPEGKGLYTSALLIPNLAIILFTLGITSSTTYHISAGKQKPSVAYRGSLILGITILAANKVVVFNS
ncbi:MAG: hypothetical protein NUV65_00025 [Candidatus Roizmanbacteria bacterium]|nr:hypothetical protein [Candidatus Roizmanbacteria bacterium]